MKSPSPPPARREPGDAEDVAAQEEERQAALEARNLRKKYREAQAGVDAAREALEEGAAEEKPPGQED